jgi:hypothetical protein
VEQLARHRLLRTARVEEAEDAATRVFLLHRITPASVGVPLDMHTNDMAAYHFDLPVAGHSRSSFGCESVDAETGEMVP